MLTVEAEGKLVHVRLPSEHCPCCKPSRYCGGRGGGGFCPDGPRPVWLSETCFEPSNVVHVLDCALLAAQRTSGCHDKGAEIEV